MGVNVSDNSWSNCEKIKHLDKSECVTIVCPPNSVFVSLCIYEHQALKCKTFTRVYSDMQYINMENMYNEMNHVTDLLSHKLQLKFRHNMNISHIIKNKLVI